MALPNFSAYVAPGEYWEATPSPVSPLSLATPSMVALVGPGIGYRTYSESITLTGTTPESLTKDGVNVGSIVVTDLSGTLIFLSTSDYTISTTGSGSSSTNTIVRQSASVITSGQTVVISYQYTDSNYLNPAVVSTLLDAQSLYGNGIDITSGAVTSPLALAAQFAFTNGASQLVLIATPNATVERADLSTAYGKLQGLLPQVNLVVPLYVNGDTEGDTDVAQDLQLLIDTDANVGGILRVGIFGAETTSTTAPDVLAASLNDQRIIEAWPNQMNYYNGYTNATLVIGGFYLAAAYAGLLAGGYPQDGITRSTIRNFTGISSAIFQTMTTAYKNQLSAAGVAVAEISRAGVLWCRHGTTTAPGSIYTAEVSLVRAQDAMVELLEGAVEQAGIIGKPIGPDSAVNLQALTIGILESCAQLGIIESYRSVTAQQLQALPTTIQVTFQYQPSYPLNYVTFVFSVNTTTGAVSAGTSTGQTS